MMTKRTSNRGDSKKLEKIPTRKMVYFLMSKVANLESKRRNLLENSIGAVIAALPDNVSDEIILASSFPSLCVFT
jgi:hypothetical protein